MYYYHRIYLTLSMFCQIFYSTANKNLAIANRSRVSCINTNNKKYVLWNMDICPIASKVGHVTLATPPLGSFIVPYVVLDMAYPTKKKRRV